MKKHNEEKKGEKEEKILKWRLSEKPTVESLTKLVENNILTKEEARQILLDETEYNSKDFDDVLKEIELLRSLVLESLNKQPQTVIKIIESSPIVIRDYQRPYQNPYITWCFNTANNLLASGAVDNIKMSTNMADAMNLVANHLQSPRQF